MQTKKRAKPVKFAGKKEEKKEEKAEVSSVITPDDTENNPHKGHGIEAHFSSTTINITESFDEAGAKEEVKAAGPGDPEPEREDEAIENIEDEKNEPQEKSVEESQAGESPRDVAEESHNTEGEEVSSSDQEADDSGDTSSQDPIIEQDGAFFNRPPDEYDNKRNAMPYFLKVFVITFLVGLAFFAGIYYTVSNKSIKFPSFEKKVTEVTKAPTPTEKPVDLTAYSIKVLNGTTTTGMAGKLKTALNDAGFKADATGNADKIDYVNTEIAAKKTVDKSYLVKLKEFLNKTYNVGSITDLETGQDDVVITIGSASAK